MKKTKVKQLTKAAKRRLVIPLVGFPGVRLTASTVKQNLFDSKLQFRTISALVEKFDLDIVFFMMDLTVEAEALGIPVEFVENEAPFVKEYPIKSILDLGNYSIPDPEKDGRMPVFIETMKLMAKKLNSLKGSYIVGPFTLAGHLAEPENIILGTITKPDFVEKVVEYSTEAIMPYAEALTKAGADILCILEPTAVTLSPEYFEKFAGQYIRRIAESIPIPIVLHICGDTTYIVEVMIATGVQGLSLDSLVNLKEVAKKIPNDVLILGNIDPFKIMTQSTPPKVREVVKNLLSEMSGFSNFILATGCDLSRETPLENIATFLETGRNYTRP